ncbi:MAG: hypothetical protein ABIJ96_00750 [Elusimicrobiota bacterium]
MRRLILPALLGTFLFSGCAKPAGSEYAGYRVAEENLSLEVPKDWRQFGARWNGLGGAPNGPAFTRFIAESLPQHEGVILGAYISLTRVKKGADRSDLERALFTTKLPGVEPAKFAGFEARVYVTEYQYQIEDLSIPMRAEGVVIDAPAAYFVLEYRANSKVFEKYRADFAHAKKTFQLKT